jgi:hypothetical protein
VALLNDPVNVIPKKQPEHSSPKECLRYFRPLTFTAKRLLPLYCVCLYSDMSERSRIFFPKVPAAVAFRYFPGISWLSVLFLNFFKLLMGFICIIPKFHRTLLRPLITTKIERILPFEKGGPGGI